LPIDPFSVANHGCTGYECEHKGKTKHQEHDVAAAAHIWQIRAAIASDNHPNIRICSVNIDFSAITAYR